jgi:ribosomal-protein-alanine N-acetyltransferase
MADIALRSGTAADVAAMYWLDNLCFAEPFRFDLRAMRNFATQRDAIVVVAEASDLLLGIVIVEVSRRTALTSAYVVTLDVHPEHRRAGLARAPMAEAQRRALALGVNHIRLHVSSENAAAISFYERIGFERIATVSDFYAAGLDAFYCVKRIAGPA